MENVDTRKLGPRSRKVKILATTGPACNDIEMLRRLFQAGADAFRVNMSHGEHEVHARTIANIRKLEKEFYRPIAILADLQGPKLRVGTFKDGYHTLVGERAHRLPARRGSRLPRAGAARRCARACACACAWHVRAPVA